MKRIISTNLELDWEYLSIWVRGSRNWKEFGFHASAQFCWSRNTVTDTDRHCTANIFAVTFLWWRVQVSLWI